MCIRDSFHREYVIKDIFIENTSSMQVRPLQNPACSSRSKTSETERSVSLLRRVLAISTSSSWMVLSVQTHGSAELLSPNCRFLRCVSEISVTEPHHESHLSPDRTFFLLFLPIFLSTYAVCKQSVLTTWWIPFAFLILTTPNEFLLPFIVSIPLHTSTRQL